MLTIVLSLHPNSAMVQPFHPKSVLAGFLPRKVGSAESILWATTELCAYVRPSPEDAPDSSVGAHGEYGSGRADLSPEPEAVPDCSVDAHGMLRSPIAQRLCTPRPADKVSIIVGVGIIVVVGAVGTGEEKMPAEGGLLRRDWRWRSAGGTTPISTL